MKRKIDLIIYIVLILAIVLTMAFIFGNSMKGPEESSQQSDKVVEIVRPIIDPNQQMTHDEISFVVRKSAHFIEYLMLGIECALLAFHISRRLTLAGALYSAGGCLLSADIDEYIQSFTGRGSAVSDVLLDFSGAIAGITVGFALAYAVRFVVVRITNKNK